MQIHENTAHMDRSVEMTKGKITGPMLAFTLPMLAGALMQQLYNITDSFIVGRFIGPEALAATGTAYALMTFLTSVLIGLSMGSGTVFSMKYGAGNGHEMRRSIATSFIFTGSVAVLLCIAAYILLPHTSGWLMIPEDVDGYFTGYMTLIYAGIPFTFTGNFMSAVLRAAGDSRTPVKHFAVSVVLNILLDILLVPVLDTGIEGAAAATVISQAVCAAGITMHIARKRKDLIPSGQEFRTDRKSFSEIMSQSTLTSIQQSVMNLGILAVQGLVNSFGTVVMTAFAAAVKIDAFAYMPVQEFGNAFSIFTAQNHGAGRKDRIRKAFRNAAAIVCVFSVAVSAIVFIFAEELIGIFTSPEQTETVKAGAEYLRIEGAFYAGIGMLFLYYGYYRAIGMPAMSVVLTVLSLGSRVMISFSLARTCGVEAIWWSVPAGWIVADAVGYMYRKRSAGKLP